MICPSKPLQLNAFSIDIENGSDVLHKSYHKTRQAALFRVRTLQLIYQEEFSRYEIVVRPEFIVKEKAAS